MMLISPVFNLISVSASDACAMAALQSVIWHHYTQTRLLTVSFGKTAPYTRTVFCISLGQLPWAPSQALTQLQLRIRCALCWAILFALFPLPAPLAQTLEDVQAVCEGLDEVQDTA